MQIKRNFKIKSYKLALYIKARKSFVYSNFELVNIIGNCLRVFGKKQACKIGG